MGGFNESPKARVLPRANTLNQTPLRRMSGMGEKRVRAERAHVDAVVEEEAEVGPHAHQLGLFSERRLRCVRRITQTQKGGTRQQMWGRHWFEGSLSLT